MKNNILLIAAFFIFFANACKEDKPTLSIPKMTNILKDMHIAEAFAQQVKRDSLNHNLKNEDSLLVYNAEILEKYNVKEKEFHQNIDWYKNHPDILDSIYQNILTEIAIYQTLSK